LGCGWPLEISPSHHLDQGISPKQNKIMKQTKPGLNLGQHVRQVDISWPALNAGNLYHCLLMQIVERNQSQKQGCEAQSMLVPFAVS